MPLWDVKSPDGKVFPKVEAPTLQEAIVKAQRDEAAGKIATPGKIKPQDPMGAGERFMTGMGDPLVGGKQLYTHATGTPEQIKAVDEQVKQREAEIQRREGGGLVRGIGAAATMAPLAVAGPAGGVAGSAVGGAVAGALQPEIGQGDYWSQKFQDAAINAAIGAGTGMVGASMAPRMTPDKATVLQAGMQLTPGELYSGPMGLARRAEEAFKSWPILGSFIRGAEQRTREGFNEAFINQGLDFIGGRLPRGTRAGYDAIASARDQFNQAYDRLYSRITSFQTDNDFVNGMRAARMLSRELGADQQRAFEAAIENRLGPLLHGAANVPGPGRAPVGDMLRTADTGLRNLAESARRARRNEFADHIDNVRGVVNDAVIRQNPVMQNELDALRTGYAMFARARSAATRRVKSDGVFTPGDVAAEIKSADKRAGGWRFSRGDALGQEFAQAAERVIGSKMADSGTPERQEFMKAGKMFLAGGGGAAAGNYAMEHPGALKYMAATGMLAAPYTRPGMAALNALGSGAMRPVGQAVRAGSALTGPVVYGGPQQ